ncbi:agl cluster protein AglQ [Halobacteria archaeon AArc-curdl1]|uniref:Agl cluster protein AglQ n=1 Tax=Natronosalvus hydrolyticus TaxID=2979988 RepID=A0AAP2Z9G1_9EURY|nr:agl cluster protein AglQ [Halobacteria archaeon AArc-curdl1]
MVRLHDLLVDCAEGVLENQDAETGALPPGHNGPWDDPETPVRNTGHWAITFLECYDHTGEQRFRDAAENAISYLRSEDARPHGQTFHHRQSGEKDRCNGLVGQAWSIEALTVAATRLERPELIELAEAVFLAHPFDDYLCAWNPVEIDGTVKPVDMTFNHQLWFAAAGGLLAKHPESGDEVNRQVRRYLDALEANLNVYENGLVYHPFKPDFDVRKYGTIFLEGVKAGTAHTMILGVLRGMLGGDDGDEEETEGWAYKSVGYHSFNLYAFALLKEAYPEHPFWRCSKFQRTLEYATDEAYVDALDGNPYGYPYNCSGIEMAYVLEVFGHDVASEQRRWLERQFARTYDAEAKGMTRNNPDPTTLTARLYEATRVPDLEFELEDQAMAGK